MPKSNRTKRKVKNRSQARRAQVKRKRARHKKTIRRGMRKTCQSRPDSQTLLTSPARGV